MEEETKTYRTPKWREYYSIILWWMNEKFHDQNNLSGYDATPVQKSIDGNEEYYSFWVEIGNQVYEKGHEDYMKDNPEAGKFYEILNPMKKVTLDDLQELNLKLKEAGADEVYIQTKEMYVHGQAALYNYISPNILQLLIKK